jgi:glycosyltransferase involved in cell wall biosynthesis
MDKQMFYNTILTLSLEARDSLLTEFRNLGVEFYSLGLSLAAGILFGPTLLMKFLKKHPADIIHASDVRSSLVIGLGPRNIPRIITRREAFYKARTTDFGVICGTILEAFHSAACRRADKVVAVSNFVREAAGRIKKTGIDVILNGVDTEKFTPASEEQRRELRNRLRLPQHKRIFTTAGFLNRNKDPLTIIKGFLSSTISEQAVLLFLGNGPLHGKCKRLARGYSNIHFIGFINNVAEYLRASDFFVLSSLFEGCPNAALEAMSCGLPVVLSDIEAHREIMGFNAHAGKLFKPKDPNSLAERMEEISSEDYSFLQSSALSIAREHLNARRMSVQYEKLYKDLY